jgi:hypothetical protein
MAAAPHPIVCPQFFEIGIDSEESLGESKGASKVKLTDNGIFFLENNTLKCKQHRMPEVIMSQNIWDIDYDDNMLIALQYDGTVMAWKGEIDSYAEVDDEDIDSLSRKLFVLSEVAESDSPHIICLRGDVGVVCVISHSTLRLVKIESDLSISLSHSVDITNKDNPNFSETVSDCKIWGNENLYVAYSVLGSVVTIYSIDSMDKDMPCKLCLQHEQEGWATALSNGQYGVFAAGDSAGTVSFFCAEKQITDSVVECEMVTNGASVENMNVDSNENCDSGNNEGIQQHESSHSVGANISAVVDGIKLLYTATPFMDSPVTITAILATDDNIWWISTSDGVVYCTHFYTRDGEVPSLTKLKKVALHSAGWGACAVLWEPYVESSFNESEWQRINGVLSSVCKETGVIAQAEVFDFSDLVCQSCPLAIETMESVGNRMFVKSCTCLPQLNILVVVDEASEVTLWSLLTGVMALELNTEVVKGKIISIAGYEFLKTDKYLTNFILFFGLVDGSMYACYVSRYETQYIYEFQQSTTVFSVLDLIGTLSKQLPSKVLKDDDSSLMGVQEQDGDTVNSSVQGDRGVVEIPDSWEINFTKFAMKFKHPPLPVSDIFISSRGQHVCICYARCSLYVYTIDTGALAFHVDLEYEQICDISKVVHVKDMEGCDDSYAGGSVFDQDSLILSLLGKTVLKLFDALTGVILTEVNLEEDDYANSIGDTFQFCGVWDLTEVKEYSNNFVAIIVTNNGNVYAFGNHTPLSLIYERNSILNSREDLGAMDTLPMGVEVFDIWSAFIVVIRFTRSMVVFKFDMREAFFSVIRSQTFTIENDRVSIIHAYPLEGDYQRSTPRIVIILSDGTTCTFNM